MVGLERGEFQGVDQAVLGLESLRGQGDAVRASSRWELAGRVVERVRALKSRTWSSPELANAVDLYQRVQLPRERDWVAVPRLLPGEVGQPERRGVQQLCSEQACYPPVWCHFPFPVLAARLRPCPLGGGCLQTWEGVEMVLHLMESHTLDCLELLCKYSFLYLLY